MHKTLLFINNTNYMIFLSENDVVLLEILLKHLFIIYLLIIELIM
jgi:hypothetical protein